jgi:hypothetical protein
MIAVSLPYVLALSAAAVAATEAAELSLLASSLYIKRLCYWARAL